MCIERANIIILNLQRKDSYNGWSQCVEGEKGVGFIFLSVFFYVYLACVCVQVWNMELLNCAQILARHEGSVTCVLASNGRVFSGAVDSTLKVR